VPALPADESFHEITGQPETLKYAKNLNAHDPWFGGMFASAGVVQLAELLLGGPVVGQNLSLFNKPPRVGDQTPPHQDGYYFKLDPMEAITLWLAVDVVDAENGCVRYIPGSHRGPMRPHQRSNTLGFSQSITDFGTAEDRAREVAIEAAPGDLLAHHWLTVHRADPNRSARTRRAIGMVFNSARAKPDQNAIDAYQKRLYADLSSAEKI